MEGISNIACPVCTLYLRPGITLESHLTSHPKQRVIAALIRVTQLGPENVEKVANACPPPPTTTSGVAMMPPINVSPDPNQVPSANHSFIYQQFMSSSGTQPVMSMSPINPQFVAIPTVFNPQAPMVMPQYIFQQQQQVQIMAGGAAGNIRSPNVPSSNLAICAPIISEIRDPLAPSPGPPICTSSLPSPGPPIYTSTRDPSLQSPGPPIYTSARDPLSQSPGPPIYTSARDPLLQSPGPPTYTSARDSLLQSPGPPIYTSARDPLLPSPGPPIYTSIRDPSLASQDSSVYTSSKDPLLQSPGPPIYTSARDPLLPSQGSSIYTSIRDMGQEIRTSERDPLLPSSDPSNCTTVQDPLSTSSNLDITSPKQNNESYKIENIPNDGKLLNVNNYDDNTKDPIDLTDEDKEKQTITDDVYDENNTVNTTVENQNETDDDDNENELNKACQTTQMISEKDEEKEEIVDTELQEKSTSDEEKMVFIANEHEIFDQTQTLHITSDNDYEEIQNNIACNTEIELQNENTVTVLEMDDMNFILPNDFIESEEIISNEMSKSSEVELETNRDTESQVLMDIGEEMADENIIVGAPDYEGDIHDKLDEDCVSRESLNIMADEKMPARGELSEQESNGASEIGWGSRIYQEGSSGMSTSYDLLARESWEASDCSDSEMPPLQSRIEPSMNYNAEDVDEPDAEEIEEKKSPPTFEFDCSDCGKKFRCPKERRVHQTQEHASGSSASTTRASKKRNRARGNKSRNVNDKLDIFKSEDVKSEEAEDLESKIEEIDLTDTKECLLCNTCGELLPSMRDLNIHNRKKHNIRLPNTNFTCKMCNESFRRQKEYIEHLKVHPLECIICGKQFYKQSNLKLHLKRHSGYKPFKCEFCEKSFFARQKLREHTNIHTGISPIKCTMCDEKFKRYSNLVQHRNFHHLKIKKKTRDYICQCGEICTSKSKLNWHKETHEAKPKSCTYCNEKFIHMASLTRHIRRAHNQHYVPDEHRKAENVECKICKGVYLKSSIDAHLNIHTGKKQHACAICNKEFTTKWNLKLHKWIHAAPTNKPFKCDICQCAYFRESDYTSHMNSHRSVKPYTCNYCGCKFIRKYNCVRHVKEHEEVKSYNCEVCSKSFHRSYYLKEHMRVHTGARPFACNICGKTSTTKSNHNKHMKIHHAREPVTTEG